jgi:hypothetical protein
MPGKFIKRYVRDAVLSAIGLHTHKAFDIGTDAFRIMCYGVQWMAYQKVRKKTEAFFEKGRLYQTIKTEEKDLVLVYTKETIEKFINKANDDNFLYMSLDKNISRLNPDDVFLLLDIKRYRFDYVILTVLLGEEVRGIILHSGYAMYPWDVFKEIS